MGDEADGGGRPGVCKGSGVRLSEGRREGARTGTRKRRATQSAALSRPWSQRERKKKEERKTDVTVKPEEHKPIK